MECVNRHCGHLFDPCAGFDRALQRYGRSLNDRRGFRVDDLNVEVVFVEHPSKLEFNHVSGAQQLAESDAVGAFANASKLLLVKGVA